MAYSLREVAIRALRNMYIPDRGLFAFRLRRRGTALYQEGLSRRYTAVALIGLAGEPDWTLREVLAGRGIHDVCAGLLSGLERVNDLGEVALTLWASRAMGHPECTKSLDRLRAMRPHELAYPTVELSWSLSSLTAESASAGGIDRFGLPADHVVVRERLDRIDQIGEAADVSSHTAAFDPAGIVREEARSPVQRTYKPLSNCIGERSVGPRSRLCGQT